MTLYVGDMYRIDSVRFLEPQPVNPDEVVTRKILEIRGRQVPVLVTVGHDHQGHRVYHLWAEAEVIRSRVKPRGDMALDVVGEDEGHRDPWVRTETWSEEAQHILTAQERLYRAIQRDLRTCMPEGDDAIPVGPDLDEAVAKAMVRWKDGEAKPYWAAVSRFTCEVWGADGAEQETVIEVTDDQGEVRSFWPSSDAIDALQVFKQLGSDIWGSASLHFDGDCFDPPPFEVVAHGGGLAPRDPAYGWGETAEEAICRCFLAAQHPDRNRLCLGEPRENCALGTPVTLDELKDL